MYVLVLAGLNAASVALALYALSTAASHYLKLPDWKAIAAGMVGLGIAGAAYFWIMFFDTGLAPWVQMLFFGACIILLLFAGLRRSRDDLELVVPCAALFLCAVVLVAWMVLFAAPGAPNIFTLAAGRWTSPLPGDNEIPFHFATQLREAQITTPMYVDWLSSDRPPLQTGMYLLLNLGRESREAYQASATALQMLSVAGVWVMARAMGASRVWSLLAVVGIWATPLVFVNGVFVWPKLLAGGYVAIAAAVHFAAPKGKRSMTDALLAGGGAALGLLAHGATAFALVGFVVAALATWRLFSVRYVLVAALAGVVLYGPWIAYQNIYDPPGNRLMKWHLAAIVEIDDRSLVQTLADQYAKQTPATWIAGRIENAKTILDPKLGAIADFATGRLTATKFRDQAFMSVMLGLGLFALALWGLPGFFAVGATRAMAAATMGALVAWAGLMLWAGQTVTHQGSYFPQLALVAMAARIFSGGRVASWIGFGLVGLHVVLMGVLHALP